MNILKKTLIIYSLMLMLLIAFVSCAGSPYRTQAAAEKHRKAMINLRPDMTRREVVDVMGPPDKTELYRGKQNEPILVYLYITEGKDIVTRKWSEANYTPLVFVGERLMGWGWSYLNGTAKKYEFIIKKLY